MEHMPLTPHLIPKSLEIMEARCGREPPPSDRIMPCKHGLHNVPRINTAIIKDTFAGACEVQSARGKAGCERHSRLYWPGMRPSVGEVA